jgi:hypothetical protein
LKFIEYNTSKLINQYSDLENFKNWGIVRKIPIYYTGDLENYAVSTRTLFAEEVVQMINKKEIAEQNKWISLLKEPIRGHNLQSYLEAAFLLSGIGDSKVLTSTWAIKSAHHLLAFEESSGLSLDNYDQIVEIGPGIGDTARTLLESGYKKPYHILDLPKVYRISSYYLSDYPNIFFHNQYQSIPNHLKTLVIGTWSFSEMPIAEREEILEYFKGSDFHFLWQQAFYEYDNPRYFQEDIREQLGDYLWIDRKIPELLQDMYLIGLSKSSQKNREKIREMS